MEDRKKDRIMKGIKRKNRRNWKLNYKPSIKSYKKK